MGPVHVFVCGCRPTSSYTSYIAHARVRARASWQSSPPSDPDQCSVSCTMLLDCKSKKERAFLIATGAGSASIVDHCPCVSWVLLSILP
eukprot:1387121-Amphidinium_carterae.1